MNNSAQERQLELAGLEFVTYCVIVQRGDMENSVLHGAW